VDLCGASCERDFSEVTEGEYSTDSYVRRRESLRKNALLQSLHWAVGSGRTSCYWKRPEATAEVELFE